MGAIIFEITALIVVIAFIVFLARDDRKNRQLRKEEDRLKALESQKGNEEKE
ncbi:hypothetical protein ACFL2V_09845 [Pseudomonadota bacterium]